MNTTLVQVKEEKIPNLVKLAKEAMAKVNFEIVHEGKLVDEIKSRMKTYSGLKFEYISGEAKDQTVSVVFSVRNCVLEEEITEMKKMGAKDISVHVHEFNEAKHEATFYLRGDVTKIFKEVGN